MKADHVIGKENLRDAVYALKSAGYTKEERRAYIEDLNTPWKHILTSNNYVKNTIAAAIGGCLVCKGIDSAIDFLDMHPLNLTWRYVNYFVPLLPLISLIPGIGGDPNKSRYAKAKKLEETAQYQRNILSGNIRHASQREINSGLKNEFNMPRLGLDLIS